MGALAWVTVRPTRRFPPGVGWRSADDSLVGYIRNCVHIDALLRGLAGLAVLAAGFGMIARVGACVLTEPGVAVHPVGRCRKHLDQAFVSTTMGIRHVLRLDALLDIVSVCVLLTCLG